MCHTSMKFALEKLPGKVEVGWKGHVLHGNLRALLMSSVSQHRLLRPNTVMEESLPWHKPRDHPSSACGEISIDKHSFEVAARSSELDEDCIYSYEKS